MYLVDSCVFFELNLWFRTNVFLPPNKTMLIDSNIKAIPKESSTDRQTALRPPKVVSSCGFLCETHLWEVKT